MKSLARQLKMRAMAWLAHGRETEISVTLGLDVTAQSPQVIKVSSGIGFLDHVSRVVL